MHASCCLVDDAAVIEVTGGEARAFLNGQLSVDVGRLPADAATLAAWSAANGRVRALVRLAAADAGYLLLVPASMVETVCTKLRMYVLRADVEIAPSATRRVAAVLGATRGWLEARGLARAAEDGRAETVGDALWMHVGSGLSYVISPESGLAEIASGAGAAPRERVELAEIGLGLPQIVPATAERFLPQMLDLDRLGGVAFDKGCYPGQEVIARTQNLGKVKRRPRRFALAGAPSPPEPGTALVTPDGDEAGTILRAARAADRTELLAVVRLDSLASPLHSAAPDGPAATELPLARNRHA